MAEFPGILLLIALVLISGFIAYVGDIVGRRMGRKRLSLFGLRPRHTAIVISVVAGMLITIMTLAVAMGVSRDVKDGFLRVVEMRAREAELSRKLSRLNKSMKDLERTRAEAEEEVRKRKQEVEQAQKMLKEANTELSKTQNELKSSSEALTRAEGALRRIGTASLHLARTKDELQRDIENLRAQAAGGLVLERATPVIFGAGQPLDWQLIDGGRSIKAIREDLDRFVAQIDAQARRAGAQPAPGSDNAIVIRKPVREPGNQSVVWFDNEQVLEAVAERVHESSGGVIVRAFSVFNTHPGEPVRIDFELFRNHLVYHRGEVIAQAIIDGRQSEPVLMGALLALLRDEVNTRARAHNIMPRPRISTEAFGASQESVGDISIEELFNVVDRLRSFNGPARVTAVAAADTWTIGPLEVDLLVASAGDRRGEG